MSTDSQQLQHPQVHPNILAQIDGLSPRRTRFIDRYMVTSNATESAIYAGYQGSEETIAATASRLLRNHKIQIEIQRRLGTSIASSNEVLERLTLHARGDIASVLEDDGSFNLRRAKRRGASQLLKKLKRKTRYEKDADGNIQPVVEEEFEIHDPQAALEKLGRFHRLFTDKLETSPADLTTMLPQLVTLLQEARLAGQRARAIEAECVGQQDVMAEPAADNNQK